jgi:dimethylargininase
VLIALTREVSSSLNACELTHLARAPIDIETARAQHRKYEEALAAAGCFVERIPSGPAMPDAVFVEDLGVAFDDLAIITRPGAASRRAEAAAVREALGRYRPIHAIEPPATVDGGDVLVVGRRVYVGRSSRTNADGVAQLRRILTPFDYSVGDVAVMGCLHLKSAVTAVDEGVLLVNPEWVDQSVFADVDFVDVHSQEPLAANALRVGAVVIYSTAFPRTADRLIRCGFTLMPVDASELAKAEGAVTCCSIVFTQRNCNLA